MTAPVAVLLVCLLFAPRATQQQQVGILDSALSRDYPHGQSELVFLLDRSGSIGSDDFGAQLFFVESLLMKFSIGPDANRVAIVSYSEEATRHIDYISGEQGNKCSFLSALKEVKYTDGSSTDTALALQEAGEILAHSRQEVKRVVILLSDGISNTGENPVTVASQLKADGIEIFAIGVGLLDRTPLQRIASTVDHYFAYHTFQDFERLALQVRGDPRETMYDASINQTLCDSLCHNPFPDAYEGCCDLDAKCTCSLVGGRHACACGPGTYGLNGFLYQCKLCPRGTYKSTYEPSDRCTPCPPDSTTADEGSKLLGACYCKEGYEGDPMRGVACTLVSCPILRSPINGRISPDDCSNKYPSVCSFQCNVGYELQDPASAKRRCQANGHWTETTPQCQKVQCAALPKPPNGKISCQKQEAGHLNVYGTVCRFTCSEGYNPVGNRERTCTESGEWSGDELTCRPITCPLLPPLRHGSIKPSMCATKVRVKYTCLFRCDDGFRLEGPTYRRCEASGNWSHAGEEVACVDDVPPRITCPASVVKEADPGLSSAEVSWDMPVIQDNLDGTDALTLTVSPSGLKPPHRFEIGSVVITYTVTDRAGLSTVCVFKVVIQDTQPPTVESCPGPSLDITSKERKTAVTWDEPLFADNSKQDVNIIKSHESGARLSWGTHIVTYTATDSARLSAECRFTVRIGPTSCPNHPEPRNGGRACDQWLFGTFCRVYCNEAFEFATDPATWYICSADGTWRTNPTGMSLPWPDCSDRAPANGARRGMSSQYYAGDCTNPKTQRAIKVAFVEDFKDSIFAKSGGCQAKNACDVEYVTVYCGEIDVDTRWRRRRAAGPGDETDFANVVTLDFTVSARIRSVDTTQHENQLANAVQTLDEISLDYEQRAQSGQLQLVVENQTLPIKQDSVTVNQSVPLCVNGSHALDGANCISCAVGFYLDRKRQECRVCDEGTYQDEEGQEQCKPCPWGTWTEGPQAKTVSECRPECKPGTYSPSGLATCRPCQRGTFQPSFKQTACLPCREWTTTPAKGSRSGSDCQAVCGPGTFSQTGLQPCQPCPLGSYQPEEQQIRCLPCAGSKTTTVAGVISEEECIEIDACESTPCQNGAQCTSHRGAFLCQCVTGFAGTTCEIEIDECRSQPCLFNATCIDRVAGFDCLCMPGYEGALCGMEINECLSSPCQNEGNCQDQIAGFDCDCVDGFWGPLCENQPDPCAGQPCQNLGHCIPMPGAAFQCVCQPGFQGVRCQTDVNECDLRPCQNGGSCQNTQGSYRCTCALGFEGTHCELDIDECAHHSCANGSTCSDVIAGYQCLCPPGVTGQFCETEMPQDFLLNFTSSLTSDFSLVRTRHSEFHEITLSMWLRTTDTTNMGTPISYAALRSADNSSAGVEGGESTGSRLIDNALTVTDSSSLRVYVNGLVIFTEVTVNDGRWHGLVWTWRGAGGEWHLYVNGDEAANGTGLSTGALPGQGVFVLGQEQDALGGGFSYREAYLGEIYKLNVWDRVLSEDDILKVSHRCHQEKGNVLAWSDFLAGLEGDGLEVTPTNGTEEVHGCEYY